MVSSIDDDPLLKQLPEVEGFKVLGPCVLFDRLGQGAMGTVYRGRHLNLDIDVAVKCLNRSLALAGPSFVARFQREARLAATVHHQNLIQVYDVSHAAELHYLVMEFVRGETARERVGRKGPLRESEACRLLLGAASGLAQAHSRRIVHRDVKPDNILISCEGEVKVSDLGLAKALESEEVLTVSHAVMGTPQFMSPEQWNDASTVGPQADVWALGITLYFLLTGAHAFAPGSMNEMCKRICVDPFPDVRARLPGISADVLRVLDKCIARDVSQRYRDAGALVADLATCLANDTTVLIDPNAGSSRGDNTLVTPPPADTLTRIRTSFDAQLDGAAPTLPSRARVAAPSPAPAPMPVAPSPAATPATKRPNRLLVASCAAAALVVVGMGGVRVFRAMNKGEDVTPTAPPSVVQSTELVPRPDPPPQSIATVAPNTPPASTEPPASNPVVTAVNEAHPSNSAPPAPNATPAPLPVHEEHPAATPVSVPVRIELDAALLAKPILFTRASEFTIRGKVLSGQVESIVLSVDGKSMPEIRPHDGRFEARVAVDSDRTYAIVLACPRLEPSIALTLVRDTRPPKFVSATPDAGTLVAKSSPLAVELTFDEEIERVMFQGVLMNVDGAVARRSVTPSQIPGPWHAQWTAWDHAQNTTTGVLDLKVR